MNVIKKILFKLNGLHYSQDYLCLAKESFLHPLYCYVVSGGHIIKDITNRHVFAGYSPIIFAIHSLNDSKLSSQIDIAFSHKSFQLNEIFPQKDAIAMLSMKKIKEDGLDNNPIFFYEGIQGKHHFVSSFHQFIISLYNRLYNKKPGNVFLPGNLYQQVEIAYSLPRPISLITVGNKNLFNLFPTDLHGPIDEDHYIISLRHNGKACRQVESLKKIVISEMNAEAFKVVYSLGKNHMQDLKQKDHFSFNSELSDTFHLPLPKQVTRYRELEWQDSFIHGIHKLMFFKVVNKKRVTDNAATLSHIHNSYATWRYNNHLGGNYLLR